MILEMIRENDLEFKSFLPEENKIFFEVYPELKQKIDKMVEEEKKIEEKKALERIRAIGEKKQELLFDPFSAIHRTKIPTINKSKEAMIKLKKTVRVEEEEYD